MSPVLDDHDLVLVKKDTPPETDTLMVVIVDDEEVKSHLKKGWVKTPEETATKQKVAKAEEDGENEG